MNDYPQAKSTISCLFRQCAGCGEELHEGCFYETGLPTCIECYVGDKCKIRVFYPYPNDHED
jgi:hypothetical protein